MSTRVMGEVMPEREILSKGRVPVPPRYGFALAPWAWRLLSRFRRQGRYVCPSPSREGHTWRSRKPTFCPLCGRATVLEPRKPASTPEGEAQ